MRGHVFGFDISISSFSSIIHWCRHPYLLLGKVLNTPHAPAGYPFLYWPIVVWPIVVAWNFLVFSARVGNVGFGFIHKKRECLKADLSEVSTEWLECAANKKSCFLNSTSPAFFVLFLRRYPVRQTSQPIIWLCWRAATTGRRWRWSRTPCRRIAQSRTSWTDRHNKIMEPWWNDFKPFPLKCGF